MRDIKFRAWKKVNTPEMFTEVLAIDWHNSEIKILFDDYRIDEDELTDFELMQYTGIRDTKGCEVYGGDILTIHHESWCDSETEIVEVKWGGEDYPAFDIPDSTLSDGINGLSLLTQGEGYHFHVIGNVYENPELLKN